MKVLDASFLIDYEHGHEPTRKYLAANRNHEFVVPAPIRAEYVIGEVYAARAAGRKPDLDTARHELSWATVHEVSERTSDLAADVVAEIGSEGPQLTPIDALVAGTGRELGAPLVSSDADLTRPEVAAVVDVETYR